MESDLGKLFIGGISWDTNEDRLKEYFKTYGEVVEAVIMKDRTTGRARGFGFVVFADPAVAERVVLEKHTIDGRTVEAKKAVPRDDQHILNRNSGSIHGSPGPARTKKIFVGGLASTVTESDFKKYFDQFGTITDVVVMYDHNTQRPRGFGFITYDSEDAVDKVLLKTFHELNGKMVEVKRLSPRSYLQGPIALLSVDTTMIQSHRWWSECISFNWSWLWNGYEFRTWFEPELRGSVNFTSNLGYGRGLNPYYGGNSTRYGNAIGYGGAQILDMETVRTAMDWEAAGMEEAVEQVLLRPHMLHQTVAMMDPMQIFTVEAPFMGIQLGALHLLSWMGLIHLVTGLIVLVQMLQLKGSSAYMGGYNVTNRQQNRVIPGEISIHPSELLADLRVWMIWSELRSAYFNIVIRAIRIELAGEWNKHHIHIPQALATVKWLVFELSFQQFQTVDELFPCCLLSLSFALPYP
ncbi:heterogeneous nuclear ribonucleoprotein 1 [Cinnamomum micranthum f. kanehirae]|uniref:Heterogeneous nuclear ribonucleoprotein 1 n=1 Tax=Cinnamomum micranthum f. kanehirae TaxID=337451 RepID=A0A3S3MAT5_9MAGN|nr:heterogeneous nuclear ribonucleoprotein 1 [Cinnamomum micranthum f. kanehirae]